MITLAILMIAAIMAVVMLIVGAVWFAYETTKANGGRGSYATTVPQEEFKFVMKGGTLHKILPNMKNGELDKDGEVVDSGGVPTYRNPLFWMLKEYFGIYWVSILYPLRKTHTMKIDKYRLKQESSLPAKHGLIDLIDVEPNVTIDSLRRFIPRPLFIKEVELADAFSPNFVIMTEWEVVNPRRAVFNYQGKFFPILDAAVEGALNDFGNTLDYKALLKEPLGRDSNFSDFIKKAVDKQPIGDKKETGLARTIGIKLTNCYVVQFGLPAEQQAGIDAARARETKTLEAEGVRAEADGQAYAITTVAKAQADSFAAPILAMKGLDVNPDLAATLVGRKLALEAATSGTSKLTVFVEGGSSTQAGINITTPAPAEKKGG